MLRAALVRDCDDDLHIVAVPSMMFVEALGGQPHPARCGRHAGPKADEHVEVAALEVGGALIHQPSPRRQLLDTQTIAVGGAQLHRNVGIILYFCYYIAKTAYFNIYFYFLGGTHIVMFRICLEANSRIN
jgi:hypothetical protein